MGDWAGVANSSAESYCKSRWPNPGTPGRSNEQAWGGCISYIQMGKDPAQIMGPAPTSGGTSLISDFFSGFGKVVSGGITGAAQTQGLMNQQALLQQQQAQKSRQTQMLIIAGVVGLGAFMLLRNRD
jgi:hypothetical protein